MAARSIQDKAPDRKRPREASWTCSCKTCDKHIEEGAARVEVAVELTGRPVDDNGPINWSIGSPMTFHRACWQQLLAGRAFK